MNITGYNMAAHPAGGSTALALEAAGGPNPCAGASQPAGAEKSGEVSRQFEAILLRQVLSESMKPLLEGGPSGQVYGYLLTDSLADTMSKGGGMGLAHILQAQLTK